MATYGHTTVVSRPLTPIHPYACKAGITKPPHIARYSAIPNTIHGHVSILRYTQLQECATALHCGFWRWG